MLKISNTKKTRFKLAIVLEIFFGVVVVISLQLGHPEVAETTIAAMMTVGTGYLLGDSYRKSENVKEIKENIEAQAKADQKDQLDV